MKKNLMKLSVLVVVLLINMTAFAQLNSKVVKDLQDVLKKSLYQSEVTISDDGSFNRKDNNGNTFTYNINDIKSVSSENDVFRNLLIKLKKGKKAIAVIEGKKSESSLNVFAYSRSNDCKKAIELFNKLIEK